ncbi:MAG TPA: hypothetical protein VK171_06015 [Fimbriimonas sp.]|nr:hypothetical protein [Fimbriimonas sp.]
MSKKSKPKWVAWLLPGFLICLIPTAIVGTVVGKDLKSRIGQSKWMVRKFADSVIKNSEKANITPTALERAKSSLTALNKTGGKPLEYGIVDAVPSVKDFLNNSDEVTFNLPVKYEKGVKTWIFRVKNTDGNPVIIDVKHADSELERDSIGTRLKMVKP